MKDTFICLMALAIAGSVASCNNTGDQKKSDSTAKAYSEIEKASWLIGGWQSNTPEGTAAETWEKQNDSTLTGRSYFVIGADTVSSETIRLEQNGDQLFYIPVVKDQNNNKPVKFTLTSSTDNQLIFENPSHDFPQKISYTRISQDSLLAEISGTIEGKLNSQAFPMKKVK